MTVDDEMVDLALRWRQWNGAPEGEIFVHFGVHADEYYRRLSHAIEHDPRLTTDLRSDLRRLCRLRLAPPPGPHRTSTAPHPTSHHE